MSSNERRLQRALVQAIGFLELELPRNAVEVLQPVEQFGRTTVQWHVLMGEGLRGLFQYSEAIPYLEQARDLAPKELDIYLSLGWCYKRDARLPSAIEALETARELKPKNDLVLYNLACYYCLAGDKEQTLRYLTEALRTSAGWRVHAQTESDFDSLRADPEFQQLVANESCERSV